MEKSLPKTRALSAALVVLLCIAGVTRMNAQTPGTINGVFSVGENSYVSFSQGNLQYQASTDTWRFAENQWDYVGWANSNISQTYDGWIDLFCWGTSGYNHGATAYQPWSTSTSNSSYYAYGSSSYNLNSQTGQADWGYNPISNGGNQENSGWRTLTQSEWYYVFNTRTTLTGVRYAKARVNGINGVIILPDNWNNTNFVLFNSNSSGSSFSSNVISSSQWSTLQNAGAVFLPAAGVRDGTSVTSVGSRGYYWSASNSGSSYAYLVNFNDGDLHARTDNRRYYGQSVRLVRPAEGYSFLIRATPNPVGGGAVSGIGAYEEGAACTLTATPTTGFTFVNWTENDEVVSTNAQYNFTVTGARLLKANFTKPGNITFADANVKALCVAIWDTNGDGELSYDEAANVTDFGRVFINNTTITSFAELQYFTGLSINASAFYGCSNLTTITLPSSLQAIGSDAFNGCTALTSVYYTGDIAQWCGIQFSSGTSNPLNYASLFYVNNTLVRNLVFPNTVTSIGERAFYNYRSLLSLSLPDGLESIGYGAFYNCSGISGDLSLPNTLTTIGDYAFQNCTGLTGDLTLPNAVTSIGHYAFYKCTGLNGNLTLPEALTFLGSYAFYQCTGFTGDLTLPNTLTSINDYTFYGCSGFNGTLTLPNSLISIAQRAFYDCHGFTSDLILPNTLTDLADYAFYNCYGFTGDLILPASLQTINQYAFYNCDGFTSVVIPNSVTNIGNGSFYDCDGLTSVTIGTGVTQIGSGAFYSCYNLSEVYYNATSCTNGYLFQYCNNLRTLSIGENVLTLPDYAFTYCTNLERINSAAIMPPIITSTVFPSSILESVAVYVPCDAKSAYQSDPLWGNFTNYQSSAYLLTVEPEDPAMGYVSIEQYGDCDNPSSTVKADPKLHYGFVCWLKDGEQVSTDRIYTFDLTENTHLVARFESNENITNHWVPNSEPYEDYMSVIAVVQIDGTEQALTTLELGAFCGDECRGSALATYFPPTDRYIYQLPVFGNNGDVISFKLFDHNTQQEMNQVCETTLTSVDNGYGSLSNPQVLNFISSVAITAYVSPSNAGTVEGTGDYMPGETATLVATANEGFVFNCFKENGTVVSTDATYSFTVTGARSLTACFDYLQTTHLANGWNWFSTYIEQSGIDGLTMLEESLGSNGMFIKARSGQMVENYQGNYWWGGLNAIDNEQMFEVRTSQACDVSLHGNKANAWNHPITINPGWNWIGYVRPSEMALGTALNSLSPSEDDVIKSRLNFSTYFPNWGWYGGLETLVPGQGYKYSSKASGSQTLTYPSAKGAIVVSHGNLVEDTRHFETKGDDQRFNMSVMAVVTLDGMELSGEQYELGAFVGDECRGSVKLMYVDPLDRYVAFLSVLGEGVDAVSFRLYDEVTGMTYQAEQQAVFEADAMLGSRSGLYPVRFDSQSVVTEQAVGLYPNPVSRGSEILLQVGVEGPVVMELVNTLGETVLRTMAGNGARVVCDLAPGIYMVRLLNNQEIVAVEKLIVK